MDPRPYSILIKIWTSKYSISAAKGVNQPPKGIKFCSKCGAPWMVARHHKGFESLFARIWEEKYVPRYLEFAPEDVCLLCLRCHERIHRLFIPLENQVWRLAHSWERLKPILRYQVMEKWRKRFVKKTERWLENKIDPPSPGTKKRVLKRSKERRLKSQVH